MSVDWINAVDCVGKFSIEAAFHRIGVEADTTTCKHTIDAQHDDKGKSLPR